MLIKASKTDLFRAGMYIFVSNTNCRLCPAAAVLAYKALNQVHCFGSVMTDPSPSCESE